MASVNEERIRIRAHEIWEEEGRPEGRDRDHWEQAWRELSADEGRSFAGPGVQGDAGNGSDLFGAEATPISDPSPAADLSASVAESASIAPAASDAGKAGPAEAAAKPARGRRPRKTAG